MTAVTSHQHLPELIDDMPQGEAKEMVLQLCGHSVRYAFLHITDYNPVKVATEINTFSYCCFNLDCRILIRLYLIDHPITVLLIALSEPTEHILKTSSMQLVH